MKKIISILFITLFAIVFFANVSQAKYNKKCVASCSTTENACHKECTVDYFKEMTECNAKKEKAKEDCVDTLNNNYGMCQGGCNDKDNMCIDDCLAKKK